MMLQTDAKIFLAAERSHTETDGFRSLNTFNFGNYQNEHKRPFGALYVWNDDTLAGGQSFQLLLEEDSFIFLLPVVGAVQYKDTAGNEALPQAGQSFFCLVRKGTTVTLGNPYEDELVNFLQGWIKSGNESRSDSAITSFTLDENKNRLLAVSPPQDGTRFLVGKFNGRSVGVYKPPPRSRVFVFVIQGAFEVQNRLLETRDALALWTVDEVEFEALSNDAILLLLQVPG